MARDNDKPRRFRDPIYDLARLTPDKKEVPDLALQLIDTAPYQRLRRIRQLGFADFVYPSASHTRFAHSLGVFVTAERIVNTLLAQPDRHADLLDDEHSEDALLAALLHDLGHGPFSHAFEAAHKAMGINLPHEEWTRRIIQHEGHADDGPSIGSILGDRTEVILEFLTDSGRDSCWSGVVSSSLDADRLDYIRRDRWMSGTGTGAIDFTWLLEHVCLLQVPAQGGTIRTFGVKRHALQQAEAFLLARYHLYSQVYFHKVNRGFEKMLAGLLKNLFEHFSTPGGGDAWEVGLSDGNSLVRHLRDQSVDNYLRLDDAVLMAALQEVSYATGSQAALARKLARRILRREKAHCVDLEQIWIREGAGAEHYQALVNDALRYVEDSLGLNAYEGYFFDQPTLSVYGQAKEEVMPPHKRLWIAGEDGTRTKSLLHRGSLRSSRRSATLAASFSSKRNIGGARKPMWKAVADRTGARPSGRAARCSA